MIEDLIADVVTPVDDSEALGAIRVVVPYSEFVDRRARRLRVALELKREEVHPVIDGGGVDPIEPVPVALAASLPVSTVDGLR